MADFDAGKALESVMDEAKSYVEDPSRIDSLLLQFENSLQDIPAAGQTLASIPRMISMVKSYITKEYTEVSVKVIVTIVAAFLYVVKKKDLVSDSIPVIGKLDDIAVITLALQFVQPELEAYAAWRDGKA